MSGSGLTSRPGHFDATMAPVATIKDIADKAGVSLGTVDRVLHNRGRVSRDTIDRVQAVIEELGFTPNLFARNLSTSRSWVFGVLIPHVEQDSGFWLEPLDGMKAACKENHAYRISLKESFFDRYQPGSFVKAHQELLDAGVDAIIMAPVIPQAARQVLDQLQPGGPIHICVDTGLSHERILCQIGQDSRRSGRMAAHLMRLMCSPGCTLAVLKPDTDNSHIGQRVQGITESLEQHDYRIAVKVLPQEINGQVCLDLVNQLREEFPGLAGIIVTDASAHLLAQALSTLGSGLALIGYDLLPQDIPFLEQGQLAFLITQEPYRQGKLAVESLFEHLVLGKVVRPQIAMPINVVSLENYTDFLREAGSGS